MAKAKNLSLDDRNKIIALHSLQMSRHAISRQLKISRRTVAYNINKFCETGSVQNKRRKAHRKTSAKEDNYICQVSLRNRKMTAVEITAEVNGRLKGKSSVSVSTVKRRLREKGLFGRTAVKKPLLRSVNKKKRLQWARAHKHWTIADWNKVLWSDESKFEIFGNRRKTYVRRRANEKYMDECLVPSVKHGGGSVMVWGCFAGCKVGNICKIEGILKKEGYKKILQKHAVPSGLRLVGPQFEFQQDNDPKHTSKLCKTYLLNLQKKKKLKIMQWPPQSPDLNPIELLWEELDRSVRKYCPTSASDLWEKLQQQWHSIQENTLNKLVARMPRLCKAVIKHKGGHFDEKKV